MNILPKKRWHVRTKENIARVRKDEAEAAEKEREEKLRIENANKEARLTLLKNKSKQRLHEFDIDTEQPKEVTTSASEHINLFADLHHAITTTNKEHDEEVKEKKEGYEKKIGYLTYLGQGTNEALGKKNWYEVLPQSSQYARPEEVKDTYEKLVLKDKDGKPKKKELDVKDGEIDWKLKQQHDPINKFKKYCEGKVKNVQQQQKNQTQCSAYTKLIETEELKKFEHKSRHKKEKDTHNKKHKRDKDSKKHQRDKDKSDKLQKLREARLKREQVEKHKTEMYLSQLNGGPVSTSKEVNKITPKYNSQFNPELARQNYR